MLLPTDGKNQLEFQTQNFLLNLMRKKFIKKSNILEGLQTLIFSVIFIINHAICFRFLPISRHLCITQANQNWSIQKTRIGCNWRENFRLSQKERFLQQIQKVLRLIIACELVSTTISIALFWQSQRFIYFLFFFYLSFVIQAKPTFLDCVNSNIFSCILSLLKL